MTDNWFKQKRPLNAWSILKKMSWKFVLLFSFAFYFLQRFWCWEWQSSSESISVHCVEKVWNFFWRKQFDIFVLVTSTVLLSNVHVCQHREDQAFGYFQVNLPVCGSECRLVEMSWGNERFSRGSHTFFRSVTFTLQQLYLEGKMDGHGIQPF